MQKPTLRCFTAWIAVLILLITCLGTGCSGNDRLLTETDPTDPPAAGEVETAEIPADKMTDASGENGKTALPEKSDELTAEKKADDVPDDENTIIEFTMFSAYPGNELWEGNDIQELIAEKTGVRVKESWLTKSYTSIEAVDEILTRGGLTDFIDGGDGMNRLLESGVLLPWDDYLERYPNIKALYSDEEWERFRQKDGHIYWANVFGNTHGKDRETKHNDAAFWIQVRVLEWAGYPTITTLDDYFDLLDSYYSENPAFINAAGEEIENIPYTILCDDWRYFCIESAPQFLDGYPNNGNVIVNTTDYDEPTVVDFNTTPTAKRYFERLNEEYNKGNIDREFAVQSYDDYIKKLSTGAVLGMFDQFWDFSLQVGSAFAENGLDLLGCDYVPLGLTISEGMEQRYHVYDDIINPSSGIAVTTACSDPERAFRFLNDILEQEIHDLRFWGVEGVDYLVDENGLYYRTEEMRERAADASYAASHFCGYLYMPQWLGTSEDGINAMQPSQQSSEFFAGCSEPLVKCFMAYGAGNYPDMLGSSDEPMEVWFPMYSSSSWAVGTPGTYVWKEMGDTKHEWLPKVVMAEDFEKAWSEYMEAYNDCNPQVYMDEQQDELERRISLHK